MVSSNDQGQHRISRIYLKQFGFLKNDKYSISVVNLKLKNAEILDIDKFSKKKNIFDLPFNDLYLRRHLEQSLSKIENEYGVVISNLQNQKQLTPKNRDILCHFVSGLICRSESFGSLINDLLKNKNTRANFIREITMFSGNNELTNECLSIFKLKYQLNIAIGVLMNFMVKVLRTFNQVVIKDFENLGWPTSDCPVVVDRNENYDLIIPLESEIYLPLSRDFCLFMYHERSKIYSNPLRNLKNNKVNSIDMETFEKVSYKIGHNLNNYLILPLEINPNTFLDNN